MSLTDEVLGRELRTSIEQAVALLTHEVVEMRVPVEVNGIACTAVVRVWVEREKG